MINTGWTGGAYGTGKRIPLAFTRAMVKAVLNNQLSDAGYYTDPVFGMRVPVSCPGVPTELMNPRNTWKDKAAYDAAAHRLAAQFIANFEKYAGAVDGEIMNAAPLA